MEIISKQQAVAVGLKKYFTGKPCLRGHISQRYIGGNCCECTFALSKEYAKNNPEKVKQARDKWTATYPEKKKAYAKKYVLANYEKVKAASYKWAKNNPEKVKAIQERTRAKNKHKFYERRKKWVDKNLEHCRTYRRNRISKIKHNGGHHNGKDILEIYEMQKGKCAMCKINLNKKYDVDHIMPISKGGTNNRKNLQILCTSCNRKKHAKDPLVYARLCGLLL